MKNRNPGEERERRRMNMRGRRRKISRRAAAGILAAVCLSAGAGETVQAAPALPEVDETMYVNLDYYGKISKINVVKGWSLNGNTRITDYGIYQNVVNMSNQLEPERGEDSLTWNFEESPSSRFYYQCTMDESQVVLPWDLDVSYKLNGVPSDGEKLAGASGLVEIHIQAVPNEQAKEYYRSNMILLAAVPVDRSKCYSVEAEGSQTQSLGDTTAVVFSALPGEEGDFTVRIGTDSFETTGVIFAMAPGTVKDLEHIKDLKKAKDTWQDAGDAFYDSLDEVAEAIEGMESGLNSLRSGVQSAEDARQVWSGAKDGILESNDQVLASISAMNEQMAAMVPHLESAKEQAEAVHSGMNNIVNAMQEMQEPLRKLYTRLKHIQNESESLSEELPEIQKLAVQIIALDAQLQANEQVILTGMEDFAAAMEEVDELYYQEEEEEEETERESDEKQEIPAATASQASISTRNYQLVGASMGEVLTMLQEKAALLTKTAEQSAKLTDTLSNLGEDAGDSAKYGRDLVDSLDLTIEEVVSLRDSLDVYYPEVQAALSDAKELVNRTTEAVEQGVNTMTLLQNALKASSDSFDAAARDSLKGSMEVLDQSLKALESTASMRRAGRTMKDTLDQELDRFDTENRFLFMDPSARKISFTSDKNQEPETLQVVLRTQEISLEDEEHQVMDAETQKEEISPFQRMWNVLVRIWQAIVEIFRER